VTSSGGSTVKLMALNLQDFLMNGLFNKIDEVVLFVIEINQWVGALIIDLR
jgi:hypothetical protein